MNIDILIDKLMEIKNRCGNLPVYVHKTDGGVHIPVLIVRDEEHYDSFGGLIPVGNMLLIKRA